MKIVLHKGWRDRMDIRYVCASAGITGGTELLNSFAANGASEERVISYFSSFF